MPIETKRVRIWPEIYYIYKDIADKYEFYLSNLISAILLEAALNPGIIVAALTRHFDIDQEEALRISVDLQNMIVSLMQTFYETMKEAEARA